MTRAVNTPESLRPLMEEGLIQEVIRPLRSGKEAQVFLVLADGEERVAKVYKEAHQRSFKHRSQYTEGRTSRNSRDQRAIRRQSKYGKSQDEAAWRSAEADIIYRLRAADVRVPEPFSFSDSVLVMALVRDEEGKPARRLADLHPTGSEAQDIFDQLISETVKMLCAGVVHGDLSEFNVLMGATGPVIIDFPQALDPAKNRNAKRILLRDVGNLDRFLAKHHRNRRRTRFGQEMWDLFEKQALAPDTRLTGRAPKSGGRQEGNALLAEMEAMEREAKARREALGLPPPRTRAPIARPEAKARPEPKEGAPAQKRRRRRKGPASPSAKPAATTPKKPPAEGGTKRPRRRRRRRKPSAESS